MCSVARDTTIAADTGNARRYITDSSLSRVAKHLRLLGVDCAQDANFTANYLLFAARTEGRFVITRSTKLIRLMEDHNAGIMHSSQRRSHNKHTKNRSNSTADQQQQQSKNQATPATSSTTPIIAAASSSSSSPNRSMLLSTREGKANKIVFSETDSSETDSSEDTNSSEDDSSVSDDSEKDPVNTKPSSQPGDQHAEEPATEYAGGKSEISNGTSSTLSGMYEYYLVKSIGAKEQLREVVDNLKFIFDEQNWFTRCCTCNGQVKLVEDKESIRSLVYANTFQDNDEFYQCDSCHKIFWGCRSHNPHQRDSYAKALRFAQDFSYHSGSSASSSSIIESEHSSSNGNNLTTATTDDDIPEGILGIDIVQTIQ